MRPFIPLLLAACGPTVPDGPCDDFEWPQVIVDLTADGQAGLPADATVVLRGVEGDDVDCVRWDVGDFACWTDAEAPYTVVADAWGYAEAVARVDPTFDACGRSEARVSLDLQSIGCPDVMPLPLTVEVVDGDGQLVDGALVEVVPLGEDWTAPEPCQDAGGEHLCLEGTSWSGDIEVWASHPDVGASYDVVFVDSDECGPITTHHVASLAR